jgi:hypothetical protein
MRANYTHAVVARTRSAHVRPAGAGWLSAWSKLSEIAWTAPQVISYRLWQMAWAGWPPSGRDRREYSRMGQEKVDAFAESAAALAMAWPATAAAMLNKSVAPVHRRVRANHRRLSRR